MDKPSSSTNPDDVSDGNPVPEVNVDEIRTRDQDAETEVICDPVKGLDANRYATKKTVAQGMLDIALLTSNASQLKYVLQVGSKHEFYTLLVVLISISIVLQVSMGFVLLSLNLLRDCRLHKPAYHASANVINYGTTAAAFAVTTMNVLIAAFDSSLARYLELDYATAGAMSLVLSYMDGEKANNESKKKIADWVYHITVGLMTGVIFCDVLKMTFGLDPALSEKDNNKKLDL